MNFHESPDQRFEGLPDFNFAPNYVAIDDDEGGTHVPFLMRWPNRLKAGTRFPHAISHLDIMPTALGAASLVPRAQIIDGVNLLPYLNGQKAGAPHDMLIWREGHYQAVLSDGWKMQRSNNPEKIRLFNLAQDPFEKKDLSVARGDKLAELNRLLDDHNDQQAEPMWPSNVEIPIWIDKSLSDQPTLDDDFIYWPN